MLYVLKNASSARPDEFKNLIMARTEFEQSKIDAAGGDQSEMEKNDYDYYWSRLINAEYYKALKKIII